jgi:hypothetical protein
MAQASVKAQAARLRIVSGDAKKTGPDCGVELLP